MRAPSSEAPSVTGGLVLGIASTVVNPPARAAAVPVDQSSLWVWPGSRMWVCTSTRPGGRGGGMRGSRQKKGPPGRGSDGLGWKHGGDQPRLPRSTLVPTPLPDPALAECMPSRSAPPSLFGRGREATGLRPPDLDRDEVRPPFGRRTKYFVLYWRDLAD